MSLDVLEVLGLGAVDVARQIEVEVVLLDLGEGNQARVPRNVAPFVEGIDDLVNVPLAQSDSSGRPS